MQDALRASRDKAVERFVRNMRRGRRRSPRNYVAPQAAVERESEQSTQQKLQAAVSIGATLVGALARPQSDQHGNARPRHHGGARHEPDDEGSRRCSARHGVVEAVQHTNAGSRRSAAAETQAIAATSTVAPLLERVTLLPKRGQVSVQLVALGWDPA